MQSLNDIQIKKILAYNIRRAYIGRLTAENLGNAFALIKRSRDWDNPVSQCNLAVGNINGDVICNALWYEMSYNPGRFGDVSPFVFNGRNSIYRFCDKPYGGNLSGKAADVIASIRHHLIEYMNLNSDDKRSWRDVIIAPGGNVSVGVNADGHSDDMYKMLAHLRDCIKVITRQNVSDFAKKRGQYRQAIINVVNIRHPDGVRSIGSNTGQGTVQWKAVTPTVMQMEYDEQDRIDKMLESAQIIMDNKDYVSAELYNQALYDMETLLQRASENQY